MPISHNLRNLPQRVQIARREQIARIGQRLVLRHPPSFRTAGGRPARTARGWRCARPRLPKRSIAPNRTRTARRGRRFPARNPVAARMARISSSDSSRASTTRLAPRLCAQPHALRAGDAHLRAAVNFEVGRDLAAPASPPPRSCTMMASAPASAMAASARAASVSS